MESNAIVKRPESPTTAAPVSLTDDTNRSSGTSTPRSEQISSALRAELTPEEVAAIGAVHTTSQEAYDLYMLGNAAYEHAETLQEAVDLFEAAVEIDPGYALAWARLSEMYSAQYQFHEIRTDERLQLARAAADRAFAARITF